MSKIKYARQKRRFDCGPTVIVNAIKFYGGIISYAKEYKSLCDIMGVEIDGGCTARDIKELIELSDFPYKIKKVVWHPKVSVFKKHLATGNAIMFIYNGHVSLITQYANKKYTLVNHYSHKTITRLDHKAMNELVKQSDMAYMLIAKEF